MDIVIAGAHGKIARRLARLLVARGDSVRGLIRNPGHAEDLRADGSEPVLLDLEAAEPERVVEAVAGADAVVFAAGAGPGSGPERKLTVDRDGAIKLLGGARAAEVPRYVMISSVGAESPPDDDDVFSVYLRAKAEAEPRAHRERPRLDSRAARLSQRRSRHRAGTHPDRSDPRPSPARRRGCRPGRRARRAALGAADDLRSRRRGPDRAGPGGRPVMTASDVVLIG